MSPSQQNQLIASLYRQVGFAKLMEYEQSFFLKQPLPSGIKGVLKRMKDNYGNGLEQLKAYLPFTAAKADEINVMGEEKLRSMSVIIEKLFVMDESQVAIVEQGLEGIKISYEEIKAEAV